MRAAARTLAIFDVTANLELVKVAAFALMVVDHWYAYVLGEQSALADFAGSLVLPLFALSFAYGWARGRKRDVYGVLWRLVFWATVAQVCASFARPVLPLNIMYSFAAGFGVYLACSECSLTRFERGVFFAFAAVVGVFTEFLHAGIAVVFFALMWAREPREWVALGGLVALAALQPFNASWGAFAALPVFCALGAAPWIVPRVKRAFYPLYALQFIACWLVLRAFE